MDPIGIVLKDHPKFNTSNFAKWPQSYKTISPSGETSPQKVQKTSGKLRFLLQVAILKKNQRFKPTLPKIEMEPENDGLEDGFPLRGVYSQVPC